MALHGIGYRQSRGTDMALHGIGYLKQSGMGFEVRTGPKKPGRLYPVRYVTGETIER
jgi:hypothetical protein